MNSEERSDNKLRSIYAAGDGVRSVFTDKVSDYVAARPDYPPALFETLKSLFPPSEHKTIADVGAGTGLFTGGLLECGYRVIAVEINPEMRQASDGLLGGKEGYSSIEARAESMPLESGSMDLITAAQAFQWFEMKPTRAEFLRVLKEKGQVALIWNDRVFEDPLHVALDQVFKECSGDKRVAMAAYRDRSDVFKFFGSTQLQQFSWPHAQYLDYEGLLSLVFSRSYIPSRKTPEGKEITKKVKEIFSRFSTKGTVEVRYQTLLIHGRPE